jgi:MOSC domain-containing protein YiiM
VATIRGRIKAISISAAKGVKKSNVPEAELRAGFGVVGDAHAGLERRQVSLLAVEAIDKAKSDEVELAPGDFAENITTEGIEVDELAVGTRLRLGESAEIEITQIGKRCHGRCTIFERLGDCIMPRQGTFAKVIQSGTIKTGDVIEVIEDEGGGFDSQ